MAPSACRVVYTYLFVAVPVKCKSVKRAEQLSLIWKPCRFPWNPPHRSRTTYFCRLFCRACSQATSRLTGQLWGFLIGFVIILNACHQFSSLSFSVVFTAFYSLQRIKGYVLKQTELLVFCLEPHGSKMLFCIAEKAYWTFLWNYTHKMYYFKTSFVYLKHKAMENAKWVSVMFC